MKTLARVTEAKSEPYRSLMSELEQVAQQARLKIYRSKYWEYPWTWGILSQLEKTGSPVRLLDIGTANSPFPWWLAKQGFDVTVSDHFCIDTPKHWMLWTRAERTLGVKAHKRIMDARKLRVPDGSCDVYLSNSVVEHIHGKDKVVSEARRVLRPGGLMILTFDIVESTYGMTTKNEYEPLDMAMFDRLFWNAEGFEPLQATPEWNVGDIPETFEWAKGLGINYIVGGAALRRR